MSITFKQAIKNLDCYVVNANMDLLPDTATPMPDEQLISKQIAKHLAEQSRRVLEALTPREQVTLKKRFGLEPDADWESMECTAKRIRQIEAKAIRKLTQPCHSKKIRSFVS